MGGIAGTQLIPKLIENCYNLGSVTGTNSAGISFKNTTIKMCIRDRNEGTVEYCDNSGKITAGTYIGGIVGFNKGTVRKCTNSGGLKANSPDDVYNTEKGTGGIAVSYTHLRPKRTQC